MIIFKDESVLNIRRGLENRQPFLDRPIYSERSAFGPNIDATLGFTLFPGICFFFDPTPNRSAALGHGLKTTLLTWKPSFLTKILSLADRGEGRDWIRIGRVKIEYVVHFALAQT